MYGVNYDSPKMQAFIERLMVDEKFQGHGYGFEEPGEMWFDEVLALLKLHS
jgi:hypothetical protein